MTAIKGCQLQPRPSHIHTYTQAQTTCLIFELCHLQSRTISRHFHRRRRKRCHHHPPKPSFSPCCALCLIFIRQHSQVPHGGPAVWAVEGRVKLGQSGQDAALLLAREGAANHDGGSAGTTGQHITHPWCAQLVRRAGGQHGNNRSRRRAQKGVALSWC